MFVNTIDSKALFTKDDGTIVRDLTQTMFQLRNPAEINYTVYKVPRDFVMRPDLISKAVYNNSLYAEVILKFNGISNPFSINEDDLILIPDLESAKQKIKDPGEEERESRAEKIRNTYKYIDPIKIPSKGEVVKEYNERELVATPPDSLPPNFSEPGTSQITYRGGRVYFGESTKTCLKNGISTGEFLTNVITTTTNRNRTGVDNTTNVNRNRERRNR